MKQKKQRADTYWQDDKSHNHSSDNEGAGKKNIKHALASSSSLRQPELVAEDTQEDSEMGSYEDGDDVAESTCYDEDDEDLDLFTEDDSLDDDELQRYWGFKVLIVPMQLSGTAMVEAVNNDQKRLIKLRLLAAKWTLQTDEALVAFVCSLALARQANPISMVPNEIRRIDIESYSPRYDSLLHFPEQEVQLRLLFLQGFNRRVRQILPLVDLSCDKHDSKLANNLRVLRGLIFTHVKESMWGASLQLSHSNVSERPTVLLDRMGALGAVSSIMPTLSSDDTSLPSLHSTSSVFPGGAFVNNNQSGAVRLSSRPLFLQMFEQLNGIEPALLRHCERGYIVKMLGEHADDSGGPYREALDVACHELQSARLPIFIPCPNQRNDVGAECRDSWLPNPNSEASVTFEHPLMQQQSDRVNNKSSKVPSITPLLQSHSSRILDYLVFLGKLMGIAVRTGCHNSGLVLCFPAIVWKFLVQSEVTFSDVCQYDKIVGDKVRYIEQIVQNIKEEAEDEDEQADLWQEETEDLDLRQSVIGADGAEHELFPGGKEVVVQWADRHEYVAAIKSFRVHEVQLQCEAMAYGMSTQIPRAMLSLFTPRELELMVCGEESIDLDFLKEVSEYVEPLSEEDDLVSYFWEAMRSFSQEELSLYLRFIWGRTRLPARNGNHRQNTLVHKLCYLNTPSGADPDKYMPVGHTCFLRIDLPNYRSANILRRQLLFAITHTQCIDADAGTTAEQQAQAAYTTD